MSRSERLFELLQALRRHRRPVSGKILAAETGVSIRTLYRDIASLQAQGAEIDGEPGVGYVLKPGFLLPPLMFRPDEIDALVLGARWVAQRTDHRLRDAAKAALARISAVLPDELRATLDTSTLLVGPSAKLPPDGIDTVILREAIRNERKLLIDYCDGSGEVTQRMIWPFALSFFDEARVLIAWCELRKGFRHFRTDRIAAVEMQETRYPKRRQILLREWREAEAIPPRDV